MGKPDSLPYPDVSEDPGTLEASTFFVEISPHSVRVNETGQNSSGWRWLFLAWCWPFLALSHATREDSPLRWIVVIITALGAAATAFGVLVALIGVLLQFAIHVGLI